jgi:hypothetical protein
LKKARRQQGDIKLECLLLLKGPEFSHADIIEALPLLNHLPQGMTD